jgi:glycosyltransferase involved in cell wall biosynthesis
MEAMAAGLCVVATAVGGTPEVVIGRCDGPFGATE